MDTPLPQKIATTADPYPDPAIRRFDEEYRKAIKPGQHASESKIPNKAIFAIKVKEAFDSARPVSIDVLDSLVNDGPMAIKLSDFAVLVLANLTHKWFGIPVDASSQSGRETVGNFAIAAQYIFSNPNPTEFLTTAAENLGKKLLAEVKDAVERDEPSLSKGIISEKILNSGCSKEDVPRTITGLVQGMIAPTMGSFFAVMVIWNKYEKLWRIQQSLLGRAQALPDNFERADTVLRKALIETMQRKPIPSLLHRTAVKNTKIGNEDVQAGQHVVLGLLSATTEQLGKERKNPETNVLFGGDYGTKNAPVHACPGQPMGIGILLGMISAILEYGTIKSVSDPRVLIVKKIGS